MQIVGCDFHPSFQQVAILDISTGEVGELKLMHATGEAERFYRDLEGPVLIGMESTGSTLWFERLIEQLGPAGPVVVALQLAVVDRVADPVIAMLFLPGQPQGEIVAKGEVDRPVDVGRVIGAL